MTHHPATTIVTLTARGRRLGERLRALIPDAEHLHRPRPFAAVVRDRFSRGQRLALVSAVGIAVRVLAPVLKDKHSDPAVVVLDEGGRFVVPLVAGHEGGANAWGQRLARATGGVCVVTGARPYTHPVHVAGLGCARGCGVETLGDLLDRALAEVGLGQRDLAAVASIDLKGDEGGLLALAEHLNVPVGWYSAQALNRYHSRLTDPSEVVFQAVGCYGVAEGAALAHAEALTGDTAELLLPKRKNAHATVALARAYRDGDEPESTLPPREAR